MKTWKDIYQYALGALIVLLFATILILAFLIEQKDNAVMNTLVGAFASCVVMVVSYFFGSSKGSADKNDLLKTNGNG
jgi:archaellum biogenesis protein FlaJ (TadC family)